MQNQPLFSLVIPTYNRVEFLKRALKSALSQTYKNIEIIILDNASNDGTFEYLLSMASQNKNVKIITNSENIGFARNLQQISSYVNGKYTAVLSDDDYLMAEFVQNGVCSLEKSPDSTLWYCRASYIDKNEKLFFNSRISPSFEQGKRFVKEWLKGKRMPIFVSVIYRVDTLNKIGWFCTEPNVKNAIDMTIILPCAWRGNVIFDKKILCFYTMDTYNLSHTTSVTDWFAMNFALYNCLAHQIVINKRYWTSFFIRFLFSSVTALSKENFFSIYRNIFKSDPLNSTLCSIYYTPHILVRKIFGRGLLFQKVRSLLYFINTLFK